MIFLLLIVTKVVANTDADFYAVQKTKTDDNFYVFTRIRNCSVYECELLDRLFFNDDGIWKIGKFKESKDFVPKPRKQVIDEIDCKNISSFVESKVSEPYQPFRKPFIRIFISNLIL